MDQENQISIDINSANEESLTELQGVGAHLARRIIEERPFETIDDLTRVRGISANDVKRLRPFLTIANDSEKLQDHEEMVVENETIVTDEAAATEGLSSEVTPVGDNVVTLDILNSDEELAEQDQSGQLEEFTSDKSDEMGESIDISETEEQEPDTAIKLDQEKIPDELEPEEEPPEQQPVAQSGYVTRGGACSLVLIGGFLTLLIAVAVTLGILSTINQGHLEYASPSQITSLQSQVDTLTSQSKTLAEDINGMRNRMDNLESLSGQVSEMETEINTMQQEIDELQVQIAANQAAYEELALKIEDIEKEIETLVSQSDRFESFLDGLRTLMGNLFPQTPEVEEIP